MENRNYVFAKAVPIIIPLGNARGESCLQLSVLPLCNKGPILTSTESKIFKCIKDEYISPVSLAVVRRKWKGMNPFWGF